MTVSDRLRREVDDAGEALAAVNAERAEAVAAAREVAVRAYEAGMTEVELSRRLGVDRAGTVRRWLGK